MFGFLRREALVVLIGNILVIGKYPGCNGSLPPTSTVPGKLFQRSWGRGGHTKLIYLKHIVY